MTNSPVPDGPPSHTTPPGWYLKRPRTTEEEWEWDGQSWTGRVRAPRMTTPGPSPASLIVVGFILALFGPVLALLAAEGSVPALALVGWVVTLIAGVILTIGLIAAGVRLGHGWADYDRQQRHAD